MNWYRLKGRSARFALASAVVLPVLGVMCAAPALARARPVLTLVDDLHLVRVPRRHGRTLVLYDATRCTDYLADLHRIRI